MSAAPRPSKRQQQTKPYRRTFYIPATYYGGMVGKEHRHIGVYQKRAGITQITAIRPEKTDNEAGETRLSQGLIHIKGEPEAVKALMTELKGYLDNMKQLHRVGWDSRPRAYGYVAPKDAQSEWAGSDDDMMCWEN